MTLISVAPDVIKRPYRLRCAFTVASGTTGRALELAKLEAGGRFIKDMALRGYEWASSYGYKLEGPTPHMDVFSLPGKAAQQKNPTDMGIVQDMTIPTRDEDYRLIMTFVMPERHIQTREELCR